MLTPNQKKPGIVQIIISISLMIILFVGFSKHPALIQKAFMYIPYVIFGFGAVIFFSVFSSLAWQRFFPKSFEKSGIHIEDRPSLGLVGSEGKGSRLRFRETGEGTVIAWSPWDYALMLVATFFFGPFMIGCMVPDYKKIAAQTPFVFLFILVAICGVATYSFFSTLWTLLFNRPTLLIKASGIEFRRGNRLIETFRSHQTERVFIENHTYVYQSQHGGSFNTPNYILSVNLEGGKTIRLCISDKKEQIENLKSIIESKFQIRG